jgi:hypothetical protein
MSFGFVVTTFCTEQKHLDMLRGCLDSIRKVYPDILIVVVDDFSTLDVIPICSDFNNVKYVKAKRKAYELAGYDMFLNDKWFDTGIFIHDTMHLKKELPHIGEFNVKAIWSFRFHQTICNSDGLAITMRSLPEPQNEFNVKHGIQCSDQLCKFLVSQLPDSEFRENFDYVYYHKNYWLSCFGMMTIMKHEQLVKMYEITKILEIIPFIKDRHDRFCLEYIFGIAIHFTAGYKKLDDMIYEFDCTIVGLNTHKEITDPDVSEYFRKYSFER